MFCLISTFEDRVTEILVITETKQKNTLRYLESSTILPLTCNNPHKPLVGLGKHVNKLRHTQNVRIYTESRLRNTPY